MYLARNFGAHWITIVLLALLGGVGTGVLAARQPPSYRSEVQLLVTFVAEGAQEPPSAPPPDAGKHMQRRVKSYASMMNTSRLTVPVIESLGLPDTPAQLADDIVASSPLDSLAVDVAVTYPDAETAAEIANALAVELQRIADRDLPPAGLTTKAKASVIKAAAVPDGAEPVAWPLHAAAGALGGFGIGLGVALARSFRREGTPIGADLRTVREAVRSRWRSPRQRPDDVSAEPVTAGPSS
ncbi:lipopolysaccharide biosynthesis protein [Micromonospora sp. 15K316]|uniref:YveK family protein n=1 Tax=Micromonospora sp. 15K316 TaxID=2530376 RepID=UPI00104BCD5E|nr:lipopolysaccharide biosynthesis protein [Micromonospora sp. 15K316]TDC36593.1 lipopolysaccharide biosynthesis protein [Micromonospora sp. 15K316]